MGRRHPLADRRVGEPFGDQREHLALALGQLIEGTLLPLPGDEAGDDQSLVRATDGDPAAAFVLHGEVGVGPASPGRKSDGSAF